MSFNLSSTKYFGDFIRNCAFLRFYHSCQLHSIVEAPRNILPARMLVIKAWMIENGLILGCRQNQQSSYVSIADWSFNEIWLSDGSSIAKCHFWAEICVRCCRAGQGLPWRREDEIYQSVEGRFCLKARSRSEKIRWNSHTKLWFSYDRSMFIELEKQV